MIGRPHPRLMVVPVETRGRFVRGSPRVLFEGLPPTLRTDTSITCGVDPEGDRFLMVRPADEGAPPPDLRVVLNRFDDLRRATPGAP